MNQDQLTKEISDLAEQQRIFQQQYDDANDSEQARALKDELNRVTNALEEKRLELRQAQEKEQETVEREQLQEEHNGGLKEAIRQIFGAVCPSNLAEAVGLTEYGEMVQTFNQLSTEAVDENTATLYAMIGQQIEAKDEKIRELTGKVIGLESDAQTAKAKEDKLSYQVESITEKCDAFEGVNDELEQTISRLNEEATVKQREIDGLNNIVATKDEEIQRLREELSRAPAPRAAIDITPYKPSTTLQDKINDTQNRIKSSIELVMEGRQFRGRITSSDIVIPAIGTEDNSAVDESDTIPSAEAPEVGGTIPAPQFQSDSETSADRLDRDESVSEGMENQDGGEITRAEFETLKHEVTMLAVELKARSILPHNWAAA